ncbi:unnamed protein product [Fusarium graminearum]|nr:unnamed protein product [Fusarium graminearum]
MLSPPEHRNGVLQLNMGEGKSTVIVPMVATALADGCKMVRVIVAKPQAKQMHQMLVSKLAGLLNRPVYLLPFSRDIKMDAQRADSIQRLVNGCMAEGGILMVQLEYLLSLQLIELECHLSSNKGAVDRLRWSIEDSPSRWAVVQEVLRLIARIAGEAKPEFSKLLELNPRKEGQYPIVRFLQVDAAKAVLDRIASHICKTGMQGFPISHQPGSFKEAVQRYISHWDLTPTDVELVESSRFFDGASIGCILMLRGLFAGGILAFALGQKRWRVNYGVDPHRQSGTKLTVPYRAKDSPSPRSEFSHPDVVIALTCLSYYYNGLDEQSLFSAFRLLVKSDNARTDSKKRYPHLRCSKLTIDFYLSHLVFSKEAKEFPHKLSASGWDLGKVKHHPTTGFSGTNDSRYVLPADIKQLDLAEQKHTNALVLGYLLQPENGVTSVPQEAKGTPFNSQMLLDMISGMDTHTRVVLDFGAQVIDLTNLQFVKRWLARYQNGDKTQAVICFNDDDEIVVLDRSGKVEELETSPFSEQLDRCLVSLDESHTRGTDLKLPPKYRAVVTLGAGLTKGRLVQACMRMRKLGKGQSVEFCVPWEIEQKIANLKTRESPGSRQVTIPDVLNWVISETCLDLRKAIPLWLNQGVRFSRQQTFWSHYQGDDGPGWAEQFLEDESQTLDQRYRPRNGRVNLEVFLNKADYSKMDVLRARCDDFGMTELHTASLQEEQEQELSPETEQERQIEKPPAVEPETHSLSQSLTTWMQNGHVARHFNTENKSAFQTLYSTSAAGYVDLDNFPVNLRATSDFANTKDLRKSTFDAISRDVALFLNLFSGQLYLSRFKDYTTICDLLGLAWDTDNADNSVVLGPDGFIPPGTEGKLVNTSRFGKSPVQFLQVLIEKIRQDGGSIEKTDIGKMFQGVRLLEYDFEDRI